MIRQLHCAPCTPVTTCPPDGSGPVPSCNLFHRAAGMVFPCISPPNVELELTAPRSGVTCCPDGASQAPHKINFFRAVLGSRQNGAEVSWPPRRPSRAALPPPLSTCVRNSESTRHGGSQFSLGSLPLGSQLKCHLISSSSLTTLGFQKRPLHPALAVPCNLLRSSVHRALSWLVCLLTVCEKGRRSAWSTDVSSLPARE